MTDAIMGPADVARATGVSTDTLRYYERKGLLPRAARTTGGYRRYPASTVERVALIQRALVIGFTLSDLKRVLATRDRGGAPCRAVRDLVAQRLDDLDQQLVDLASFRDSLRQLLEEWDSQLAGTPPGGQARLLESLGAKGAIEAARRRRRDTHRGWSTRQPTSGARDSGRVR